MGCYLRPYKAVQGCRYIRYSTISIGKSRHMRIIAEHYGVPFREMLLIDDTASNLENHDGWQGGAIEVET